MSVTRAVIILISLSKICLCDYYESPSSYQNHVSGDYNSGYFQSESDNYRQEELWSSYLEPANNEIPVNGERNLENEDDPVIFSYNPRDPFGPQNWGRINANCDGLSQSPVNLFSSYAKAVTIRQPLIIDGFFSIPSSVSIENNGHSASLRLKFKNGKPITLRGGPLKSVYNVVNAHWHWGRNNMAGSEHTLDARRYSAEVHFVTYNSQYKSLAEASFFSKGIAVLGFFYELDDTVGATNNRFVKLLQKVRLPGSSHEEFSDVFSMNSMVGDTDFRYLSYKGSLTTPNCNETVTWMISTKPLKISSEELAEFRQLIDEKGDLLVTNFRPLQRLNNRNVLIY